MHFGPGIYIISLAANGGTVLERLFVYGTLGPGRANYHVLEAIVGSWETATVSGDLRNEGWGAELGYPGIDLNEYGGEVKGFLFTSDNLSGQWEMLDQFEGESYERILTRVKLKDGDMIEANIYTLRSA